MPHEPLSFVAMWVAMTLVMMVPTVLRPTRRLAQGSPVRAARFLLGYVLVWTTLVVPAFVVMPLLMSSTAALLIGWIAVGFWQVLPSTARLLRRCQGLPTDGSLMVMGARQGSWCIASCAPLMVMAMATVDLLGVPLAISGLVMAGTAMFIMWEKQPRVPISALRASGVVVIVAAAALFALVGGAGPTHHDLMG